MATHSATINAQNDTDAHFREWASKISGQLAAMGLVKQTVTGEINLTTVTRPNPSGGAEEVKGFQIWKLDDSLQATYPVVIKIEYGGRHFSDPWASYNCPCIAITVGAAHTTSTITTQTTARKITAMYPNAAADFRCSGSNARFCMSMNGLVLGIERLKDGDGADTGAGVAVMGKGAFVLDGSTYYGEDFLWSMVMLSSGVNPTVQTNWGMMLPPTGTGMLGTTVHVWPPHGYTPGQTHALMNFVCYYNGVGGGYYGDAPPNLTAAMAYTTTRYGAEHTYWALGAHNYCTVNRRAESYLAMRYE